MDPVSKAALWSRRFRLHKDGDQRTFPTSPMDRTRSLTARPGAHWAHDYASQTCGRASSASSAALAWSIRERRPCSPNTSMALVRASAAAALALSSAIEVFGEHGLRSLIDHASEALDALEARSQV